MTKIQQRNQSGTLSQRQRRVGEEVRHLLSACLMKEDFHIEGFNASTITVTEVRMSSDLQHAFAYVMPLGGEGIGQTLAALKQITPRLRNFISKKLTLRIAPILHFQVDKTFEEVDKLDALLRSEHVAQDLDDKK